MEGFEIKVISGMEKCFVDEKLEEKTKISFLSMLANEKLSFQLAYTVHAFLNLRGIKRCRLVVESPLKKYIKLETIESIPVKMPVFKEHYDDFYLRYTPGLYPDLLIPFGEDDTFYFVTDELRSMFITVECKEGIKAGVYPIKFKVINEEGTLCEAEITIEVIGKMLSEISLYHTEWFYADCLANYYNVPVWSERHWEIIENFAKAAVECGVNMLLTPVFTPPLDTMIGGERLTTQLVDITLNNGKYSFCFGKLGRWIDMCKKVGIKYFEINHLFTQWGAEHAPKIMATVDGEFKKIFGWETDAFKKDYTEFLQVFLDALISFLKEKGVDKNCFYHISDEPNIRYIENYRKAKNTVAEKLKGYPVIDTLSSYEFYNKGLIERPIPSTNHIDAFIENNVSDLWTYYCVSQRTEVSNRFVSVPGQRTRIIGAQLYKYNIKGFLHWGFNFYNNRYSIKPIDPYAECCGEYFTPAGDCFQVYPTMDGKTYSTLHYQQFFMGLEDHKALKLYESLVGREKTLEVLEEGLEEFTFKKYPREQAYILKLREKINNLIKNA